MSIAHPHHELYNKTHSQTLPLILVLIVITSFVFSSLAFNLGYKLYLQSIANLETELKGSVSWSNVYINPKGTLQIKNFRLHEILDTQDIIGTSHIESAYAREMLHVNRIEVDINPFLVFKYLVLPYSELREYDKERIYSVFAKKEKPLNYFILKSISKVSMGDIRAYLAFPQDEHILRYLQKQFFELQILPEMASILCENISSRIDTNLGTFSTVQVNASIVLSDTEGIAIGYAGRVEGHKLAQRATMQVQGQIHTNNFFAHASMETLLRDATINDYIMIKPLTIELDKTNNNIVANATWLDSPASIVGSYLDEALDVSLNFDKIKSSDLFHIDDESIFTDIINDVIVGKGTFSKRARDNVIAYQLQLRSFYKDAVNINIDLLGDQNHIQFNSFFLNFNEQLLDMRGDLSFLNWGINGEVQVKIDEPITSVPVEGAFVFSNTPYASMGKTIFLKVNDIPQFPLNVEYSWLDKFLTLSIRGRREPILGISQEESKNMVSIVVKEFPTEVLNSVVGIRKGLKYLDSTINGNLLLSEDEDGGRKVSYDLQVRRQDQEAYFFTAEGEYDQQELSIRHANFIDVQRSINAQAQGYINFNSVVTSPQVANLTLSINQGETTQHKYTFTGTLLDSSTMRFALDTSFYVDVAFSSKLYRNISTLRHVQLVSNNFTIPTIDYTLNAKLVAQIAQSQLTLASLDLTAFNNDSSILTVQGEYANHKGTVSKLSWINNERVFDGLGYINYEQDTKLLQLQILETPDLDDSNIGRLTLNTIPTQSLTLSYNAELQDLKVQANNIKLGFFSKKYSGILNTDFVVDLQNQNLYGVIHPSQIIVESNEIAISSEFSIKGFNKYGDIRFSNLNIKVKDTIVVFSAIDIDRFSSLSADFVVKSSVSSIEILNMYEGYVLVNTDTNLLNFFLEEKGFEHNDFSGSVILIPVFSEDSTITNRYRYNIQVTHIQGKTTIIDKQRNLYMVRNIDQRFNGSIGNSDSLLSAKVTGSITARDIDMQISVSKFDYNTLDKEFSNKRNALDLLNINLEGKLTLKGATLNPLIYGYVQITDLEAYLAYFDKDILVPNITMLISDSEISIVNSHIEIDNDILLFNAQGRLNNYTLDFIEFSVFTRAQELFVAKQLRFGTLVLNGEFLGKATVVLERNNLSIAGNIQLSNSLISNERFTSRQLAAVERAKAYTNDTLYITVDVVTETKSGVKFAWPTNSFPILKAGFARNQQLFISYDGELQSLTIDSNLLFDNGTIYYLSKGFKIEKLQLIMNDSYTLLNPYVELLEATIKERYENQTYDFILSSSYSTLEDLKITISTDPPLSMASISEILGQSIVPDTSADSLSSANSNASTGLLSSIIKLSDPVSNIGVFSRFENVLQRSLRVDYLSFKTKIVQKLLEYSIDVSNTNTTTPNAANTQLSSYLIPHLLDNSSLEIGKYVDIIYINLQLELESATLLQNTSVNNAQTSNNVPIKTTFNVELPTPFFDLTWTMDPSLFGITQQYVPMNMLTISWQKKY